MFSRRKTDFASEDNSKDFFDNTPVSNGVYSMDNSDKPWYVTNYENQLNINQRLYQSNEHTRRWNIPRNRQNLDF